MVIRKKFCINHPERPAIGICVITGKAICEECSTRYEGVNYSKEGLEILRTRRARAQVVRWWPDRAWLFFGAALSPLMLLLIYEALEWVVYRLMSGAL